MAIMPRDVAPELPGEVETILAELPRLGHRADVVQILIGLDKPVVDHVAHLVGRTVTRDIGNESGDIADGGLDEGVAEGRATRPRGRLRDRALHVLAAARQERTGACEGESEKALAPAHPYFRAGAGAGGGDKRARGDGTGLAVEAVAVARTVVAARLRPRIASENGVTAV